MTDLRKAAQQALEALEYAEANHGGDDCYADSITALRTALAEQLSDEQISDLWHQSGEQPFKFARMLLR